MTTNSSLSSPSSVSSSSSFEVERSPESIARTIVHGWLPIIAAAANGQRASLSMQESIAGLISRERSYGALQERQRVLDILANWMQIEPDAAAMLSEIYNEVFRG